MERIPNAPWIRDAERYGYPVDESDYDEDPDTDCYPELAPASSEPPTYSCVFFARKTVGELPAVACDNKSKCAFCGWNPRVAEQRIKNLKEKLKND